MFIFATFFTYILGKLACTGVYGFCSRNKLILIRIDIILFAGEVQDGFTDFVVYLQVVSLNKVKPGYLFYLFTYDMYFFFSGSNKAHSSSLCLAKEYCVCDNNVTFCLVKQHCIWLSCGFSLSVQSFPFTNFLPFPIYTVLLINILPRCTHFCFI